MPRGDEVHSGVWPLISGFASTYNRRAVDYN
jgi:hypothetical protein